MLVAEFRLRLVQRLRWVTAYSRATPKPLRDPACHVLICVAHSDDCVIIGAEYAYGAIRNGLSVRVAYLTCSSPHPDLRDRPDKRERGTGSMVKAWRSEGKPHFCQHSSIPDYQRTCQPGRPGYRMRKRDVSDSDPLASPKHSGDHSGARRDAR